MSTLSSLPAQKIGTMGFILIMVNGQRYILMHERTKKTIKDGVKSYGGPDSLAGPGGGANEGETPADAVVRETLEEYGLKVKIVPVQDRKVFAETDDRLSDGSFWRCNFYLLQMTDTTQIPQIPPSEKKKATRLVAVPWYAMPYLAGAVTSGADDNENEDRIEIKLKTDTVYFFESLKNLAKDRPEFCRNQFPEFWNIVSEMPNYQADQLLEHGIDMIE